jgi:plasmid stabilization system protein ParE
MVEEINDPTILEIVFDRYRIIYHYDGKFVDIVRVWPGARPLTLARLERE